MAIIGENTKILTQSKDFLRSMIEFDHTHAFEMLTKEYKKEFFDQSLIFFYAVLSTKDFSSVIYSDKKVQPHNNSTAETGVLDDIVDLNSIEKKLFYVKRGFPFFPWERSKNLKTFFALPSKPPNRIVQFLVQLFSLYPVSLMDQFKNHNFILEKEGRIWKISDILINNKRIENVFLRKDYPSLAKDFSSDLMELEELSKVAFELKKNKVDEINIHAFYQIILLKSNKMKDYIQSIEKKLSSNHEFQQK